jgi:hypothetical protein
MPKTDARNLASALLAGAWSEEALVRRSARACGRRYRWLRPLARRVLGAFTPGSPRPGVRRLADFLLADPGFAEAWERHPDLLVGVLHPPPGMSPAAGRPASWPVPALTTPGALAEWLGLTLGELDWFADAQRRQGRTPAGPLRHYRYRWLTTRRKARLLEVPKDRLKVLQRKLLHEILDRIPAHESAHGYRRGRSLLTFAAPHAGRGIVLRLDLRDFFPSVRAGRVRALFAAAGYPDAVARLLTGLCTNAVPPEVLEARPDVGGPARAQEARRLLTCRHLPQGAPTSPALANLCAYRLDRRLAGLAAAVGAAYTRYADDLVFSGDEALERGARRFHVHVGTIALEEGFEVNTRKSRFLRQGVRQLAAGVVLNVRPNVKRAEYDLLKAILTNCVRHGPAGQNREGHADFRAHLLGRIAHVGMLHAERGRRLRGLFEQIRWQEPVAGTS